MQLRSWLFAALGGAFILGAGAPAYAQHGDWHRDHRQARDYHHDWGHGHPDWHAGYAPPPVVVGPPAYGYNGYYAPPPVAYAPGISIGINIP